MGYSGVNQTPLFIRRLHLGREREALYFAGVAQV